MCGETLWWVFYQRCHCLSTGPCSYSTELLWVTKQLEHLSAVLGTFTFSEKNTFYCDGVCCWCLSASEKRRLRGVPHCHGHALGRQVRKFFEPDLKALFRKLLLSTNPSVEFKRNGDEFTITTKVAVKTIKICFKLGQDFTEESPADGRPQKVNIFRCHWILGSAHPQHPQNYI